MIPSGYLSDRIGRRKLMICGLSVSALTTVLVGFTDSLPLFLAAALVTGAATGMFISPQQAAVADIIGSKARGGTAVATFQMMSDFGAILGSLAVGQIAAAPVVRLGVRDQRSDPAGGRRQLGLRARDATAVQHRAHTGPSARSGGRR